MIYSLQKHSLLRPKMEFFNSSVRQAVENQLCCKFLKAPNLSHRHGGKVFRDVNVEYERFRSVS